MLNVDEQGGGVRRETLAAEFRDNMDAEEHLAVAAQVARGLETPEAVGGARLAPGRALVGGAPESPGGVDGAVVRRAEPASRGGRLVIVGANLTPGRVAGVQMQVTSIRHATVVATLTRPLVALVASFFVDRFWTVDAPH